MKTEQFVDELFDELFNTLRKFKEIANDAESKDGKLPIPHVMDCSTCKYKGHSKTVEPCDTCMELDGYLMYKSAIVP